METKYLYCGPLGDICAARVGVTFRQQLPERSPTGNVGTLAIRDLLGANPPSWDSLAKTTVEEKLMHHCLSPGDVVLPSRGDYYQARLFEGSATPVFPLGQISVLTPTRDLDPRFLVWFLNHPTTQKEIKSKLSGSTIQALTRTSLIQINIKVPPLAMQHRIADLDETSQRIRMLRLRLNTLDAEEIDYASYQMLLLGEKDAR